MKDFIPKLSLLIAFCFSFIPYSGTSLIIYYFPYFLVIISIFIVSKAGRGLFSNYYFKWRTLLIIGAFASYYLISRRIGGDFQATKLVILQSAVLYLAAMLANKYGIFYIIKLYMISIIITITFMFSIMDISLLFTDRLGADSLGEAWNANAIGLMCSFGLLLLYILHKHNTLIHINQSNNIFTLLILILLVLLTLLSGSRKAFLVLFLGIFLFYISKKGNLAKKIKYCIIGLFGAMILIYLTFSVRFLYDILGHRIENLIINLQTDQVTDSSIRWRNLMVAYGLEFFSNSPIIGNGIDTFRILFGRYFPKFATYAHNNYVELLADTGITGFIIYYSIFIYGLKKYFKSKSTYKNYCLVLLILIFICDYGTVSYIMFSSQFIIFICIYMLTKSYNYEARTNNKLPTK